MRVVLAGLALAAAGPSFAAGGHHAVDDAAILPKGACEVEGWTSRAMDRQRLLHAGAGCGLGWLELGVAGESVRSGGGSDTSWSLQAKTATPLDGGWSVGAILQAGWQKERPRYTGTALLLLASWAARDDLALHVNLGRDFVRGARDAARGGIAAEWSPATGWSLLAERYREQETHFARLGVRWVPAAGWQVDLSRSLRLAGPTPGAWTAGVTLAWE